MRVLHDLLDSATARRAQGTALRYRGQSTSFTDLRDLSLRCAAGLRALGVGRGDRVIVHLGNRPETIVLALACSRLGAVFVPISATWRSRQLQHVVRDSGARVLVTSAAQATQSLLEPGASPSLQWLVLADESAAPAASGGQRIVTFEDIQSSVASFREDTVSGSDIAAILYTSGSTGRSKGVVVTHGNLVSGAACVAQYLQNTAEDRILAALPLSFDYGLSQITTAMLTHCTAVLTNFSLPTALVQEIAAEAVTGVAGVPTMWSHLANVEWPEKTRETLRYLTNSGGALHPATIRQLRTRLPRAQLFCMYGLTEAFRSTYLPPPDLDRKMGSIGKAVPGQQVFVVRSDGSRCAPGEIGELVHRGSLVTLGYWRDPAATEVRFRPVPTWVEDAAPGECAVWSGDLAKQDEEGFLYFVARADQLIKTSGYRVSPTELEDVVAEVDGVRQCVALGLPDAVLGQRIVVALLATTTDRETLLERVRRHCRINMPAYMVPAEIHIVETFPHNANGKPDRAEIARLLQEMGGADLTRAAPLTQARA